MCPSSIPGLNLICYVITLNGTFSWAIVSKYLFNDFIVLAIPLTIGVAVLAQALGTLMGLLLYFMRRARLAPVRWLANAYIWFFRGTPLIVQILLAYSVFPYVGLLRPLAAVDFFPHIGYPQVQLGSFIAALAALALNEGAYMAEIVRAGIDAIDVGQMEASKSLGMTYFLAMRRIILPQAARVIIPPLGNEFNAMLKNTALAIAISLNELLGTARAFGASQFRILELYVVASFWYLVMTTVWTAIQAVIERRLNVSVTDSGPLDTGSYWSRLLGFGRKGTPTEAVAGLPADHR